MSNDNNMDKLIVDTIEQLLSKQENDVVAVFDVHDDCLCPCPDCTCHDD